MEAIKEFVSVINHDGRGDGSGNGYGYGDGYGSGYGYSYGCGHGHGYGRGSMECLVDGDGSDCGQGNNLDISVFNGQAVYQIDDIPTIITRVRGNVAKGYILNLNLTLTPCYVAKGQNKFAHGESVKQAVESLQEKIFEGMDPDEAISLFLQEFPDLEKKYPAKAFFVWHHRLTGSCEMGRKSFVKNGGYDLENDTFTVREFIEITKNAYGGDVIRQLEERIK